ncbi:MAG TPA: zinc ABC transporter permease AztB [Acidimicrobiia bacterium]|nr:zinc ABC transporter permease AztB [Acidimicrobiia bacterium]
MTDPFAYDFMRRALMAGLLAVVATSVVGTWVVLRRLAFMGDALAHGIVPGVALALLIDVDPIVGALVAAVVMIGAISVIHRTTRLGEDTAIGLLFVGMLAVGVIVISRTHSFAVDLVAVLFGDVLGVTVGDLWLQAGAAAMVVAGVTLFYRPLLTLAFNEQKAEALGMRPRLANLIMLGLITVAVVSSFRAVGALLVFGLLVAPPATAILIARRVPVVMGVAMLLGFAEVVGGLLISFHANTATGATVSALAVGVFFVVLAGTRAVARLRLPGGA